MVFPIVALDLAQASPVLAQHVDTSRVQMESVIQGARLANDSHNRPILVERDLQHIHANRLPETRRQIASSIEAAVLRD